MSRSLLLQVTGSSAPVTATATCHSLGVKNKAPWKSDSKSRAARVSVGLSFPICKADQLCGIVMRNKLCHFAEQSLEHGTVLKEPRRWESRRGAEGGRFKKWAKAQVKQSKNCSEEKGQPDQASFSPFCQSPAAGDVERQPALSPGLPEAVPFRVERLRGRGRAGGWRGPGLGGRRGTQGEAGPGALCQALNG